MCEVNKKIKKWYNSFSSLDSWLRSTTSLLFPNVWPLDGLVVSELTNCSLDLTSSPVTHLTNNRYL